MLIIKTVVKSTQDRSFILSDEDLLKGQPIWKFDTDKDIKIRMDSIPQEYRQFLDDNSFVKYTRDSTVTAEGLNIISEYYYYTLFSDGMKYICNNIHTPNIMFIGDIAIATRDINKGTVLTCDFIDNTAEEHLEYLKSIGKC